MSISLAPVLELNFHKLAPHLSPPGLHDNSDASWREYHRRCLEYSELPYIEGVSPWSEMVCARQLVQAPEVLRFIALDQLEMIGFEVEDGFDDLAYRCGGIYGGLAVYEEDQLVHLPRCCGDLRDIGDWVAAVSGSEPFPKCLWVGHPMLVVEGGTEGLRFRDEDSSEFSFCTTGEELLAQLVAVGPTLRELAAQIEVLLSPSHDALASEVARLISGLANWEKRVGTPRLEPRASRIRPRS